MANEKSRNHETGGNKGGASKHQGESKDQQGDNKAAAAPQDAGKTSKTGAAPDAGASGSGS
jgi:hypothetical protein